MDQEPYFPLFMSLKNKKILVIGGGNIAARRVRSLLSFSDDIMVIAPDICEELEQFGREGKIALINRPFEDGDVRNAFMVIAAADNTEVNDRAAILCNEAGILVNHAGDRRQSDFYFPGIIRDEMVVIGVTASGSSHSLAKRLTGFLREKYQEFKKENGEND